MKHKCEVADLSVILIHKLKNKNIINYFKCHTNDSYVQLINYFFVKKKNISNNCMNMVVNLWMKRRKEFSY